MTTEEQLDWLCRLRSEIYVYMPKEWLIPMNNALDMAIKALEQEPTTKNDLGVDCISRQEVLELLEDTNNGWIINEVLHLPPVTPQEPKTGHWIEEFNDLEGEVRFTCSCCGKYQLFGTDFCYNCGAKMVEPQESEDKG